MFIIKIIIIIIKIIIVIISWRKKILKFLVQNYLFTAVSQCLHIPTRPAWITRYYSIVIMITIIILLIIITIIVIIGQVVPLLVWDTQSLGKEKVIRSIICEDRFVTYHFIKYKNSKNIYFKIIICKGCFDEEDTHELLDSVAYWADVVFLLYRYLHLLWMIMMMVIMVTMVMMVTMRIMTMILMTTMILLF